jgi:hypothetical protein
LFGSVLFGMMTIILIASTSVSIAAQTTASQIVITPPSTWPMLAGNSQAIASGYGNHVNPRIDCNRVSYTHDDYEGSSLIHYFDIGTGTDSIVPGNGLDRLSDIKGNLVAFTQLGANGDQIVLYNTVTHTTSVIPGLHRSYPRIGGRWVAFEQRAYAGLYADEIGLYDTTTGWSTLLTTFDFVPDRQPAISPSGDVLVWKKCQPDGTSCHIWYATISDEVIYTRALTSGTGNEDFPQTDGNIISYISNKSGENDIYYQPVGGGTETRISLPGDQREPTISGNLLAFESNQTGSWEVFVYDLNSGILYQVTTSNDPFGSVKTLNHIGVCNGTGRIVYSVPGPFGDFDVSLFTFQPPDPPNGRITDLITLVRGFGLPSGIQTSLVVKLQDAIAALNAGDTATACVTLASFISEVNAQSGKKLTAPQAEQLIQQGTTIRGLIGCG